MVLPVSHQLSATLWHADGADCGLVVPDGHVEVVVERGTGTAWLLGNQGRARAWPGSRSVVGAQLGLGTFTALLGLPADAVTDAIVPLRDVDRTASALEAAAAAAGEDGARRAALLAWLAGRGRGGRGLPTAVTAARRLARDPTLRIATLAEQLGVTRQHLRRVFVAEIGLSPKHFARVRRLLGLLRAVPLDAPPQWAMLACDHGYTDQSHLIAECLDLLGSTPEGWRRSGATWFGDCTRKARTTGAPMRP